MKKDSTPEGRGITGADVWELLFEVASGDVPDGMTDDVCEQLAGRLAADQAARTTTTEGEAIAWASPSQLADLADPDDERPAGKYLPLRKTRAGNFTQPLYASPRLTTPAVASAEVREADDPDHKYAVVSSNYARPFLVGAYPTLEAALKAQDGKPDRWHIYQRAVLPPTEAPDDAGRAGVKALLRSQENVSDAVHAELWRADEQIRRMQMALAQVAHAASALDGGSIEACRRIARVALDLPSLAASTAGGGK